MFTKSLRCRQFPALSIDPCEVLREAGASIGAKPRVAASPGSGVWGRGARGRRLPWVRSSPEPSPCSEACGGGIFGAMHVGRQGGSAQSWGPNPEQDLWVQDPHGDPPGSKRRCRAGEVGLANPAPKRSGFSSKERKGGGLKTKEAIYWQADSPGKSDIKVKNRRLRKGES